MNAAQSVHRIIKGHHKFPNLKRGFALMADRRVPMALKIQAVLIAIAITVTLEILEVPVESLVAGILSVFGIAADLIVDGMETIAGPVLLSCLILPYLAPAHLVDRIEREKSGRKDDGQGPIIDV